MFVSAKNMTALLGACLMAVAFTAGHASAVTKTEKKPVSKALPAPTLTNKNLNNGSRLIELDMKNRWGFKFEIAQPLQEQAKPNDIDAGAYFRLTPNVRIGGSVGLGEKTNHFRPEETKKDDEKKPRVRLETQFKF